MMFVLNKTTRHASLKNAVYCVLPLIGFSFFSTAAFPLKLISFLFLLLAALAMLNTGDRNTVPAIFQSSPYSFYRKIMYLLVALLLGAAGSLYYRFSLGMPAIPNTISLFACFGMCVGATEEFIFRGFIQTRLNSFHPVVAIVFAALAHAVYKIALFISPWSQWHPGPLMFFIFSFAAFIIIGALRHISKSIWPAVATHVVFDIWVYAETTHAPWWVW